MLPLIDTHVHMWHPHLFVRPWLADLPQLAQPQGLPALQEAIGGTASPGVGLCGNWRNAPLWLARSGVGGAACPN